MRGSLRALEAMAFTHTGEMVRVREVQREAMELLAPGTPLWFASAGWAVFASVVLGEPSDAVAVMQAVMKLEGPPPPIGSFAQIVFFLALALYNAGQDKLALGLVSRLEGVATPEADADATFAGYLRLTRMLVAAYTEGDLGAALKHAADAVTIFDVAAHRLAGAFALNQAAWIGVDAGAWDASRELAKNGAAMAREVGAPFANEWSALWAAKADVFSGHPDAADGALEALRASPNATLVFSARAFTAEAHFLAGRIDAAEHEARAVLDRSVLVNTASLAWAVVARVELARGHAEEALEAADRGIAAFGDRREVRVEGGILHLARVDALRALGREDDARAELTRARERILRIAATLGDDASVRDAFTMMPANARTLALAASVG